MKLEFNNGSTIETIDHVTGTVRGKNHWDLSKWMKQYLTDNPSVTEQDVYDRIYGRMKNENVRTTNKIIR